MRQFAMMIAVSSAVSALGSVASAEEWRLLTGPQAHVALEGKALVYDNGASQTFHASGRTLYNAGHDSWGSWAIRDGQYCSTWPPSNLWACYGLETDGTALRFVGEHGAITVGRYQ
ncbi:hypothetical protein [Phaeobacter sp.]|uniref:hypothetical protein n=1 Tax=Phaeobacter sp. TaxID=1902409 RepID=UPI0025FC68B6|nr:hypothetical protein [Phaeobacter sp.]